MAALKFVECVGFDENVVLAVKTCFFDIEMRRILIVKMAEKIVYHDRSCSRQVLYDGGGERVVSSVCNRWFNSLHTTPSPSGLLYPAQEVDEELEDYYENMEEEEEQEEAEETSTEQTEKGGPHIKFSFKEQWDEKDDVKAEESSGMLSIPADEFLEPLLSEQFECKECSMSFKNKTALNIHRGRLHKQNPPQHKDYNCPVAGCSAGPLAGKAEYKAHLRSVHRLPKRGRKRKLQEGKRQESRVVKSDEAEGVKCPLCGKEFESSLHLAKHTKRTHQTERQACHICGQMVKELSVHVKVQHTEKDKLRYFCEFCGRGFKGYSSYSFHIAGHTGERKHACRNCGKNYRSSSEAKKCERAHQGLFKWNCNFCSYRCHQKNKFVRHLRTHTKSEPYKCPLCEHRSARKDYIQKHILKSHTETSLEDIERRHPHLYDIEEKLAFIEGEVLVTEDSGPDPVKSRPIQKTKEHVALQKYKTPPDPVTSAEPPRQIFIFSEIDTGDFAMRLNSGRNFVECQDIKLPTSESLTHRSEVSLFKI